MSKPVVTPPYDRSMKTNRRDYPLRAIFAEYCDGDGVWWEILACGHRQPPREDRMGRTNARSRRCWRCARALSEDSTP